jgi:TetR/AcrR family transcriptional regulator, transcriptional repressor of bet genes
MSDSSEQKKTRRVMPKEVRRDQLIRATMKCISKSGLSGVTMAQVTQQAGLSLGIANLHFQSKEKLLVETLRYVTDEYNRGQSAILQSDEYASPVAKLDAILQLDLSAKVTQREKMAVWFAFWGEAKSRPTYQRICRQTDFNSEGALCTLFQQIIDEGDHPGVDPALLASGYTALIDGLWLNMLIAPQHLKRAQAEQVARNYIASVFPGLGLAG